MFKKLIKYLSLLFFIFLLIIVGSAIYLNFWFGPRFAHEKLISYCSNFWEGTVEVEAVRFSFVRPLSFMEVTFRDADGRRWVHAKTLTVTLRDWPALETKVDIIHIDSLMLYAYSDAHKRKIPTKRIVPDSENKSGTLNLPTVIVDDVSIHIVQAEKPELLFDGLLFSLQRVQDFSFPVL